MLLVRIVVGITLAAVLPAQTPDPSTESSGKAVAEAWVKAWNRHDMDALAEVVDERVDFIRGRSRGRPARRTAQALAAVPSIWVKLYRNRNLLGTLTLSWQDHRENGPSLQPPEPIISCVGQRDRINLTEMQNRRRSDGRAGAAHY